jgi:hypothetical protein
MNLDDSQRQKVAKWVEEGLKLSEIQSRLDAEFGIRLTYMELRFLLDDLKLKPKDKEPPAAPTLAGKPAGPTPGAAGPGTKPQPPEPADGALEEEPAGPGGGVTVTVDQVTRPGALVSGKVTFSDGQAADWYLDQMGRLGVVARQQGYKPSQADLMAFQAELQNELARQGY